MLLCSVLLEQINDDDDNETHCLTLLLLSITSLTLSYQLTHTVVEHMLILMASFQGYPGYCYQNAYYPDFNVARNEGGGGGDNRNCTTCKAPIKSSQTTQQCLVFNRPDGLPATQQC